MNDEVTLDLLTRQQARLLVEIAAMRDDVAKLIDACRRLDPISSPTSPRWSAGADGPSGGHDNW